MLRPITDYTPALLDGIETDLRASLPTALRQPPRRTSTTPPQTDSECDVDLPRQLFTNWIPAIGPRQIKRALSGDERSKLERRAAELRQGLVRYHAAEKLKVEAAVAGMMTGFRTMRDADDDAANIAVALIATVLEPFPLWAIIDGCRAIARGIAGLDRRWPPNDAEVYGVVEQIVRPYQRALASAEALLAAQVEPPPQPRLSAEEIAAKLGRPVPDSRPERPDPTPPTPRRDGAHMSRVLADLERRRAQREVGATE